MIQVRTLDSDVKFYRKIVQMIMNNESIAKLKMKSEYDDAINDWIVPPFLFKNKEITLPSLSVKKQAADQMEHEKNAR